MKTSRFLTIIGCLGLCTACGNELQQVADSARPGAKAPAGEGKVTVDYSFGTSASRSLTDGEMSASGRINSLAYLLYDADGILLKQRQISDIGPDTEWPLKRSTMTWNQRQELKDTLQAGERYTAVFIANCLLDDASTPLSGKETLDKATLALPTGGFTDGNMYYLATESVTPATGTDRDTPYECPVTLQRIVTRTDIRRVSWGESDDAFKTFVGNLIGENGGLLDKTMDGYTQEHLATFLENLADLISSQITDEDFRDAVNRLTEALKGPSLPAEILSDETSDIRTAIYNQLLSDCQTGLASLCTDWSSYDAVTLTYESDSYSDRFQISDWTYTGSTTSLASVTTDLSDGKASLACFGSNPSDSRNRISSLTLTKSDGSGGQTFTFTPAVETRLLGNRQKTFVCNPIAQIGYTNNAASSTLEKEINMSTFIDLAEYESQDTFRNAVNSAVSQYGSWESLTITFSIPDMSDTENITSIPSLEEEPNT